MKKKAVTVSGTVYFGVHSKEADPSNDLLACVAELSAGGLCWNEYVEFRHLKVTSVNMKKGIAAVHFECQAKPKQENINLETAVHLVVWEACNYRFGDMEQDGLLLLPLRYPEGNT